MPNAWKKLGSSHHLTCSTVVNYTWSNMYWILILFHHFQQNQSVELSMYDLQMEALDSKYLKIYFLIWGNNVGLLNGHFTVHHKDCPFYDCGSSIYQGPLVPRKKISIKTSLSPCRNHSGIEVRSHTKHLGSYYIRWQWHNTGRTLPQLIKILNCLRFHIFHFQIIFFVMNRPLRQ